MTTKRNDSGGISFTTIFFLLMNEKKKTLTADKTFKHKGTLSCIDVDVVLHLVI